MNQKKDITKYIVTFGLLCVLFFLIPYTDDDLRWGSSQGMERLQTAFDGYGGRYVGYMIIMAITRSKLLKLVFEAAVLTLLLYVLERFSKGRKTYYISLLFMFLMPLWMRSQTIAWASGFANYVTSSCFTLIYVVHIYSLMDNEDEDSLKTKKATLLRIIGFFLLGAVNALIVEHFTILNICLVLFVVVYSLISYKRVKPLDIAYLCGVILGAVLMFSNSSYGNILSGTDGYRNVGEKNLLHTIASGYMKICNYGLLHIALVICVLSLCLVYVYVQHKDTLGSKAKLIAGLCIGGFVIGAMLLCWKNILRENNALITSVKLAALGACMVVALIVAVGILAWKGRRFLQCMLPIMAILILDGVFLVAEPVTPRCFMGSYVWFIVLIYQLTYLVPEDKWTYLNHNRTQIALLVMSYIVLLFNLFIYARIFGEDRARTQYIRQEAEAGNMKVLIQELSCEEYVHDITLSKDWEWDGFKDFYNIDMDVEIIVDDK